MRESQLKIKLLQIIQLVDLANPKYKTQFFIVISLTIASSFIDLFSLGLIFPIIFSFFDAGVQMPKIVPNFLISLAISQALALILIAFFLKSVFITITNKYNLNYVYSLKRDLTNNIYKKFLYQKYENKKNENSSYFINAISSEINLFANYIFEPIISGINELIIVFFGAALIIYFEPKIIYILLIFMATYLFLYNNFIKNKITKLSLDRQELQENIIQHTQETSSLYKEILIFRKSEKFTSQFNKMNNHFAKSNMSFQFYQSIPRIWIEFSIILIITAITLILTNLSYDKKSIFAILAVFSIFSFKIAPSLNRLINCIQSIRFGLPSIGALYNLFPSSEIESKANKSQFFGLSESLICDNLSFGYPDSRLPILHSLSLKIKRGELIAIVGPSGAGKSTLVDLLLGLIEPTNGTIQADGIDISHSREAWHQIIGYVPQEVNMLDSSFATNITMDFAENSIDTDKAIQSLKKAGLWDFISGLQRGINSSIGEKGSLISGGQRQRLGIARALYQNAQLLILDEPTSSLDHKTSNELMRTLKELTPSTTILIITHNRDLLNFCDQAYELLNGSLHPL
jgi:ABC-type multidrug transport system fused ATPase/permease subunit